MKWRDQKYQSFQTTKIGIKAKKNGTVFQIDAYTKGFNREHLGWYIMVKNDKENKIFNSLWKNIWFEDIEKAKEWCDNFSWESVET